MFPINRHLTGLTNRTGNFAWASFNALLPGWESRPQVPAAASVRKLLQLDVPAPYDWYAVFALSVLESFPHITALVPDPHQSYHLQLFQAPSFQSVVGELRESAVVGPPSVLIKPNTWPVHFQFSIVQTTASTGTLTLQGTSQTVEARSVGGDKVRVTWPEGSGINGLLQHAEWGDDVPAVIQYHPLSPEPGTLKQVLLHPDVTALLSLAGLDGPAFLAGEELEKLAFVLAALIKTHPLLT